MNLSTAQQPTVSIAILAGGRATRMDGEDKGLLTLNGIPLVQRLYGEVSPLSNDLLINANRSHHQYEQLFPHNKIITDAWPDFRGPLAGIHAALTMAKHDYLLSIPCDLYHLPTNCLKAMLETVAQHQCPATFAVINDDALYPLCLVHKNTLPELESALQKQQYAVRHWLFAVKAMPTYFQIPLDMPLNLNTPEALRTATQYEQQLLGHASKVS